MDTWDLGRHVLFSYARHFNDLIDGLLGPEGWTYLERSAWVWMRGVFVPYLPSSSTFAISCPRTSGSRWLDGTKEWTLNHPKLVNARNR
jgi:hypothetical protein